MKLDIKLWRFGSEIVGFIAFQEKRDFRFDASNGYVIKSLSGPELSPEDKKIFVRGSFANHDKNALYAKFPTDEAAIKYAHGIATAIKEYNGMPEIPKPSTCEKIL